MWAANPPGPRPAFGTAVRASRSIGRSEVSDSEPVGRPYPDDVPTLVVQDLLSQAIPVASALAAAVRGTIAFDPGSSALESQDGGPPRSISVYSIRIRPGGSDLSYRLARSDRPIGTNPFDFCGLERGGTPYFSSLLAIRPRKGVGRSRLRSSTTRAARRKQNWQVEQLRPSSIEALESLIRVLDQIGLETTRNRLVQEWNFVEQEPERRKIRAAQCRLACASVTAMSQKQRTSSALVSWGISSR